MTQECRVQYYLFGIRSSTGILERNKVCRQLVAGRQCSLHTSCDHKVHSTHFDRNIAFQGCMRQRCFYGIRQDIDNLARNKVCKPSFLRKLHSSRKNFSHTSQSTRSAHILLNKIHIRLKNPEKITLAYLEQPLPSKQRAKI